MGINKSYEALIHPLPRCCHGAALRDKAGKQVEVSCGCSLGLGRAVECIRVPWLPANRIDKFRIEWWEWDRNAYRLTHYVAIYHVNTAWSEFEPDRSADFIDQWALYEDGRLVGRLIGWPPGVYMTFTKNVFFNRRDALAYQISYINQHINALKSEIARMEKQRNEVGADLAKELVNI